jgi:diguanylate cyclase (GGDEF)-like protein
MRAFCGITAVFWQSHAALHGAVLAVLFAFATLLGPAVQAKPGTLTLTSESSHWNLGETMRVSQAIDRSVEPERVLSGEFDAVFRQTTKEVPSLDGELADVWVKSVLENAGQDRVEARLVFKFPQPKQTTFFIEQTDGSYKQIERGSEISLPADAVGRFPSTPLLLEPETSRTVYLRVRNSGPVLIPLQLFEESTFVRQTVIEYLVFGLLVGCIIAIAIHTGLTFFATREPAFGWFVIFALAGAAYILCGSGIAKAHFWPGVAFQSNILLFVINGIGNASSAMFLAHYLSTAEKAPRLHRLILALAVVAVVSCFGSFLPLMIATPIMLIGMLLGPPILFGITLILAMRRVEGALTLLIGWTMTQVGVVWLFLRALDVVPYTEFNHFALPLAITFTALQFSWALTSRARRAEYNATHDSLTDMPNRLKLGVVSGRGSALRANLSAVLVVDLDGFKAVNDAHGHSAGDEVLRIVAERLKAVLGKEAMAFRTGGDEFVVLATQNRKSANHIDLGNRIIASISRSIPFRGLDLSVGASVGLAIPQSPKETTVELIERADAALYEAKRSGKGRVAMGDLADERELLEDNFKLRAA